MSTFEIENMDQSFFTQYVHMPTSRPATNLADITWL